jgi:hypothetical protein
MITITSSASWDDGDLLRLNDPDNDDYDIRELSTTAETVFAVAVGAVVSGASLSPEPTIPNIVNVTRDCLFAVTDVNGTTPASSYVGEQASLDNSSGWRIDVSGSGTVTIEDIDTNYGVFIVRFLADAIQANPFS